MTRLDELLAKGQPAAALGPGPRVLVDRVAWRAAVAAMAKGELSLLDLWAEPGLVHMGLLDEGESWLAIMTLACPRRSFPTVGRAHAPAMRLERSIRDIYGLEAENALDARPWLDHGRWGLSQPLGPATPAGAGQPYVFLTAEGEGLHQIPVGPVHAGIIEPGHFRFTASGETVVRLEERLGYLHRGIEGRLAGAPLDLATRLAGRVSGDSTVAYALAFARAVEAALGVTPPPRAAWLRALMAELERVANHLGDIGAICNDATFGLMLTHCSILREQTLRASQAAFGHRLMMDAIVPGGVASDLAPDGLVALQALVQELRGRFPPLVDLYDDTASLQDRTVGTGFLSQELARRFAAGGFVGRASGRAFDARKAFPYAPYDTLAFTTPLREDGDVNARVWVRIDEVLQSLSLIDPILAAIPDGPVRSELAPRAGEGLALTEGFRGEVMAWVRLEADGTLARARLRDPSWFQWPLLEAAIEGNIVADFPLCNKSFNCSYAGVDL